MSTMSTLYSQRVAGVLEDNLVDFLEARKHRDFSLDEKDHLSKLVMKQYMEDNSTVAKSPPSKEVSQIVSPSDSPRHSISPIPSSAPVRENLVIMEDWPSSSEDSDAPFHTIQRRKRSRAISNGSLTPTNSPRASPVQKKNNGNHRSRSPSPLASNINRFSPLRSNSPAPAPATSAQTEAPTKFSRIPPIVLHKKCETRALFRTLEDKGIDFFAKNMGNGLHLITKTPRDHHAITRHLIASSTEFHSFRLPEEKPLRVVLRGIPEDISPEEIKEELAIKYPVLSVHRMKAARTKKPIPLVLVTLTKNESAKGIFNNLSSIFRIRIQVESLRNRARIGQCYRCQMHGHSANCCHGSERCVKCGEPHRSSNCQKPRDTPAKCALCSGAHTANYGGCPARPQNANPNYNRNRNANYVRNYNNNRRNHHNNNSNINNSQKFSPQTTNRPIIPAPATSQEDFPTLPTPSVPIPRPQNPTPIAHKPNSQLPHVSPNPIPRNWPQPHYQKSRSHQFSNRGPSAHSQDYRHQQSQQFRLDRGPAPTQESQQPSSPMDPIHVKALKEQLEALQITIKNATDEMFKIQATLRNHNV